MPSILTATGCLPSNGLFASTGFTLRLSVMWSTMPRTRLTYTSLDELNTAISISLLDFNEKKMAGRDTSRKEMFLRSEKDYLRPLPEKRFVMKERKIMTVGRNSYVSLFKHHYSARGSMWEGV